MFGLPQPLKFSDRVQWVNVKYHLPFAYIGSVMDGTIILKRYSLVNTY